MEENKYSHIELFAGCGGMTLGLEAAGFNLYFANELSPMAGETFAYNLLQENLEQLANENKTPSKTLWINSSYTQDQLKSRLRENPFVKGKYSDLNATNLEGKLLIGDIDKLLGWLEENPKITEGLKRKKITLLSGGPPCQSFSMAGKREKNNAKNLLPLSFAKFAGLIQPKFVLLENVKGITAPFTEENKKYYAWFEVAKAFALQGYVPVCMMLNSKYFGVAQNRPRFILLAIQQKIAKNLQDKLQNEILGEAIKFQKIVSNIDNIEDVDLNTLHYYDIESNPELFNGQLLPEIISPQGEFVSVAEAIGDIKRKDGLYNYNKSRVTYRDTLNAIFHTPFEPNGSVFYNHDPRGHSYEVKARFRIYQIINELQNGEKRGAIDMLSGKKVDDAIREKVFKRFLDFDLFFKNEHGEYYQKPQNIEEVKRHFEQIKTKKHSQRALKEDEPAPAQLTIPDDICHYDMSQLRTLTVREMARCQSFPDWFKFRSKVTTGGQQRKFEVPQYTQVGNAVPPLLAKALGENILTLLKHCDG